MQYVPVTGGGADGVGTSALQGKDSVMMGNKQRATLSDNIRRDIDFIRPHKVTWCSSAGAPPKVTTVYTSPCSSKRGFWIACVSLLPLLFLVLRSPYSVRMCMVLSGINFSASFGHSRERRLEARYRMGPAQRSGTLRAISYMNFGMCMVLSRVFAGLVTPGPADCVRRSLFAERAGAQAMGGGTAIGLGDLSAGERLRTAAAGRGRALSSVLVGVSEMF